MVESRSGSKALMFAKDPLADVEYFNRRMQLSTTIIKHLHLGDCGSTTYVPFQVREGDLTQLAGKYHMTETGLSVITRQSTELIGSLVQLRSSLTCEHPDHEGVCGTCMGQLALSVPLGTNIGHVAATELCAKVSQAVLSVKHLDGSSVLTVFTIPSIDRKYISNGELPNTLYCSEKIDNSELKLIISAVDAKHISDIFHAEVKTLSVTRVSSVRYLGFERTSKGVVTNDVVPVCVGTNLSSLSCELLEYMKVKGYELSPTGDYVVDLADWDNRDPLIIMPMKHMSMLEFMNNVGVMIESSTKDKAAKKARKLKTLVDYTSVSAALMDLHEVVSSKISVNIAHLEIIIKSAMIRSAIDKDHRLPLPGQPVVFGSFKDNLERRSLGAQFAYQEQSRTLMKAESYTIVNRPSNLLDTILRG